MQEKNIIDFFTSEVKNGKLKIKLSLPVYSIRHKDFSGRKFKDLLSGTASVVRVGFYPQKFRSQSVTGFLRAW